MWRGNVCGVGLQRERRGVQCRNSHSLGSSCICSTPLPNLPRHTWKKGCFVCETQCSQGRARHPCLSGIRDPETAARCGGSVSRRSTTEFIHWPVKGPFLLLFLAKIHQVWQVGQFEPSRGQRSRSLPQSQSSPPLLGKSSAQPYSRPGVLLSHVRSCTQKHRRGGGLKVAWAVG